MTWVCCKNGWRKDSKEVTQRETRKTEKKERPKLRQMDDVKLDLRNMVVKNGEQQLWMEKNGHQSWGKPRPNSECSSAKEEDYMKFLWL